MSWIFPCNTKSYDIHRAYELLNHAFTNYIAEHHQKIRQFQKKLRYINLLSQTHK